MDKPTDKELQFSFVIPVYNRPEEVRELLESLSAQSSEEPFEVVIVEDGSTDKAKQVAEEFQHKLDISYLYKPNTGPGDSRNYGMSKAKGNYFLILDSDCLLPGPYLEAVSASLRAQFVDCFGGPDTAHPSFSRAQKAINYAMTSFLSTGGIRGGGNSLGRFQPRSFNMGLSKRAFEASGGFGNMHPGEDPDLSIRLWKSGFQTRLIPEAYVYHKRRVDFSKFFRQVLKFGKVRPILNLWHPTTAKLTFWAPTLFCTGFLVSLALLIFAHWVLKYVIILYVVYFLAVLMDAAFRNSSLYIGFLSLWAVLVQFGAYGYGFLKSTILVNFSKKKPEEIFPDLFF